MSQKFPGIPAVPLNVAPGSLYGFLVQIKQAVELLTNQRGVQPYALTNYSVSNLPPNGPGLLAYATDGRKAGEGVGAGSGVMVFSDTTKWCACDTGLAVAR